MINSVLMLFTEVSHITLKVSYCAAARTYKRLQEGLAILGH